MKKRLLSILLAVCLLVGVLPTAVFAEETGTEGTGYTVLEGTPGYSGEGREMLVDGNIRTKWCMSFSESSYIIFKTPAAMTVAGYAITTGNDNTAYTGRNPKSWTLYGSNDYSETDTATWEVIHSVTNDTVLQDVNYTTFCYDIVPTETPYQYFKLEITATQGAGTLQMSEFVLTSCTHDWQPATVDPTCTEEGYWCTKCTNCGWEKDKAPSGVPATGHSLDESSYVPGTADEVGYTLYTCGVCGYEETQPDLVNALTLELSDFLSDGWNGAQLLINRDGERWKTLTLEDGGSETVYLPYSGASAYCFYWQKGNYDYEIGLTVTVSNADTPAYTRTDFEAIEDGALLFQLNTGDYTAVNAAIADIPSDLSIYTAASVEALRDTVNAVNWDLPPSRQPEIDAMATAINDAVDALVEEDSSVFRLSMTGAEADLYITETGYRWGAEGDATAYTGPYRLGGTSDQYRVIVESGSHEITFLELYLTNIYNSPFALQNGASVRLTLQGENELKKIGKENIDDPENDTRYYAGLNVPADTALEITAQSTGSLLASCEFGGAGIGGNVYESTGSITISGGSVTARSEYGAGIGGGYGCSGNSTIIISGGTVNARSYGSAGIGSGYNCSGANTVTISGGTVTAISSSDGAGIGTGYGDSGDSTVTISGGTVNARSSDGAGIGTGLTCSGNSIVTISGGTVTATCSSDGAGIGTGYGDSGDSTVTISGGDVTAICGDDGAGIGTGRRSPGNSTVTISGGNVIGQSEYGAGIGSGYKCSGVNTVTISGGDVTGQSEYGAGIGTGYDCSSVNTVTVTDGTVNAVGGSVNTSVGISAHSVTVEGGTVNATGGSAEEASFGVYVLEDLTITGGRLIAKALAGAGTHSALNTAPTELPASYQWRTTPEESFTQSNFDWENNAKSSDYVEIMAVPAVKDCNKDDTCPASKFTDVKMDWSHDGIHFCVANGLMNGTSDTTFEPEGTAARAMLVTVLYRMEGEPEVGECTFTDVPDGEWYTDAVTWAAENGIVEGYDGKFKPTDDITRQEFATILYRYAKYKGYNVSVGEDTNILSFDDAEEISSWAVDAMQWAVGAGLINGKGENNLDPTGKTTRAEMAAILYRFCENVVE